MAEKAKAAMGVAELTAFADRGYFKGEYILACEQAGVIPYVPKPLTSGAKAEGRFGKQDFVYDAASGTRKDAATGVRHLATATLIREAGTWKVSDLKKEGDGCAAA